jgi:hypothetical protein
VTRNEGGWIPNSTLSPVIQYLTANAHPPLLYIFLLLTRGQESLLLSRLCTATERSTKSASASPSQIGLGPIYQDAVSPWLACLPGLLLARGNCGNDHSPLCDWARVSMTIRASQLRPTTHIHSTPLPFSPTVRSRTPECPGETWRRIAERDGFSTLHPGHANRALRRQAPWLRAWYLFKERMRGVPP